MAVRREAPPVSGNRKDSRAGSDARVPERGWTMMKKHKALLAYLLALTVFTAYVVMDTFVITRVYSEASGDGSEAAMQMENGTEDDAAESAQDAQNSDSSGEESSHGHGPGSGKGGPPSGGHGPGGGGHGGRSKSGSGSSSGSSSDSSSSQSSSSGQSSSSASTTASSSAVSSSQSSYNDGKISVEYKEYTVSGTTVHVAEVSADSASYLKTAFAQGSYGKNVTATTSDIADSVNAVLAINGDYYGAREKGYVIRNGKIYRSTADAGAEDLVIYKDGSFGIINESEITAEQLLAKGAVQTLSFGPALIEDGKVSVDSDDEVGRAMASNPRTAIGIKSDGTYLFVVSDGRTDESEGLSLLELAQFMQTLGAETAYNLDGGGSSTMVFNGSVVNTPTGGGIGNGSGSERKVSDIVYIGY